AVGVEAWGQRTHGDRDELAQGRQAHGTLEMRVQVHLRQGFQIAHAPRICSSLQTQLRSAMAFKDVSPPEGGTISLDGGVLRVPDNPILPFIRGDGTGPDIWHASQLVFDAAVEKAYGGKRKISWFEVFAGQGAFDAYENWL